MFIYRGSPRTNDEAFNETFEVEGGDITNWTIEFVVNKIPAAITKLSTTQFTASLPLATMQGFCPGDHSVGCRYTAPGMTDPDQIMVGTLPVMEGNFS